MKIVYKLGIWVASLFVLTATVCMGIASSARNHVHESSNRYLEFRLAALNIDRLDKSFTRPSGGDIFSDSEAREISVSGRTPPGFKWLPMSRFLLSQNGAVQPICITRVVNGKEFLLVADRSEMILTRSSSQSALSVESAQITPPYSYDPTQKAIEIKLDRVGTALLRQFTEKYIGHSLALVVGGQVVWNARLLSPVRTNSFLISFTVDKEAEAKILRDTLMK